MIKATPEIILALDLLISRIINAILWKIDNGEVTIEELKDMANKKDVERKAIIDKIRAH